MEIARRNKYLEILFLCVAACIAFLIRPAQAAEVANTSLVRVPVYFITDRNLRSNSPEHGAEFGPHRKYIGDCKHDPYMGSGYCVLRNTSGKQLSQKLKDLGWTVADPKDKEGLGKVQFIDGKTFPEIEGKFYSNLRDAALKTDRKEALIFAHGYNTSFELALHHAARFAYYFETPVVLYSWPSVDKLRSYSSDENNNEWSQEHFNDVVQSLDEMCTDNPSLHLRIFAHSMGTRLVVRAAPFLHEKPYVLETSLICPDIDAGLVKHYARRYLSVNGTTNIRLYMSQRDKALAFSQILHGGYCRLGECADSIATMARHIIQVDAQAADGSAAGDKEFDDLIEKTKKRMQTIDFTILDRGMIGHKIPVELIKNISYTHSPGPGLMLVSQESGQRNRMSRMFSRLTHLQNNSNSIIPADCCLRVARVDNADSKASAAQVKPAKQPL